jgi:hypothetical protein
MTDALVFSLTGAEAEGSDIPSAVPMENLTPKTQEAAGGAPEPMELPPEKPLRRLEERRLPRYQNPLWRWLFAPRRSKTRSPSALHR